MRSRKGQGLVEFAVAIILFIVLFCGIFEFGWVFYTYAYLNNAVTKGARVALAGGDNSAVIDTITKSVGGIPINSPSIAVSTPAGTSVASTDRTAGNFLTVTATVTWSQETQFGGLVHKLAFDTLRSSCRVRIQ